MKIVTIIGAHPQFIKAAAVSRVISNQKTIQEVIVHTGQHFDTNMSDIFFEEMEIPKPQYQLAINSLSHGAMTGRMLEEVEKIIQKEQPDCTLVYGDTNSTLAGALAAKKLHCKVVHVEAGLRSFNMAMPEEINRILTDRISDILFCPTDLAVENLHKEGFAAYGCTIVQCGDVMEDAALYYSDRTEAKSSIITNLGLSKGGYILATVHRAENTEDVVNLSNIIKAINQIHQTIPVVLPLHPRTRKLLKQYSLSLDAISIDPVGYFDMIQLIKNAHMVMTDSGGLQKEAFFFNKFCVTLREQTEWMELVNYGYNKLAATDVEKILFCTEFFMNKPFQKKHNFYGGGKASEVIVNTLLEAI